MKHLTLLSVAIFLILPSLSAQFNWQHTNGPNGGIHGSLWYNSNYTFYTDEYFLYRTSDGLSWEKIPENAIWPMATHGSDLVGQFYEGNSFAYNQPANLKVSHDDGETWVEGSLPPGQSHISKLAYAQHGIYSTNSTEQILYRSQDEALTWDTVTNPVQYIRDLWTFEERLYVNGHNQVWRSDSMGANWTLISPSFASGEYLLGMFVTAPHILISTEKNLWHSHDDGQTWTSQNTPGLFKYDGFVQIGNTIFGMGGSTGMAKSEDFGVSWTTLPTAPVYTNISSLATAGGMPLVNTYNKGVYRWEEATQSFRESNIGLHSASVSGFANGDNVVWANTPNGLFRYDKQQQLWDSIPAVKNTRQHYQMLVSNDSNVVGVVHHSKDYFYYSKDNGVHWDSIFPPQDPFGGAMDIGGIRILGNSIFVYLEFEGWVMTQNFGQTWNTVPSELKVFTKFKNLYLAGDWDGNLYVSIDQGITWDNQGNLFQGSPVDFFLADDLVFTSIWSQNGIQWRNRIFTSSDGLTWNYAHDGLPNLAYGYDPDIQTFADFLGCQGQYFMYHSAVGLYKSLDTAKTWVPVQPITSRELLISDSMFYAGGWGGGVVRSELPDVYGSLAQGTVYQDDNNDGIQDNNENPLSNIRISLYAPNSWFEYYLTNTKSDGSYVLGVTPSAVDTLRPLLHSSYIESINPPFRIVGNGGTGLDFGIKLSPNIQDLAIAGNYFGRPRPGFDLSLGVFYSNAGTLPSDAMVSVNLDDQLNYLEATPPPTAVFGDSLVWSIAQLALFEGGYIRIKTNLPATTPLGTLVKNNCHVSGASPDFTPLDNHWMLCDTVVGSFDPNEKRVEPADGLTVEEIAAGKELFYTIQFQNTGTFEADRVRISDLLDAELDYTTCRFVAASHPVSTFRIMPGGLLEIIFEHIMLPDSNTNESASHGFITFAIQRKKAFEPFTVVRNSAAIYFDFNEPILTNQVTTPIITKTSSTSTPKESNDQALVIFPNPAQQMFTITTKEKLEGKGSLTVQNIAGQTLQQRQVLDLSNPIMANATGLPVGTYIVRLTSKEASYIGRLVVNRGK